MSDRHIHVDVNNKATCARCGAVLPSASPADVKAHRCLWLVVGEEVNEEQG